MHIDSLKQTNTENRSAASGVSYVPFEKSQKTEKSESAGATFSIDESRKLKKVTYGKNDDEDEKKSAADIQNAAGSLDAVAMKNEMVVGAKTITSEDAKKLHDDGFSLRDDDIRTVVTVTDKIKATLAASGHDVSNMGGISDAVLEELSSGSGVMSAVCAGLTSADLPYDEALTREIESTAQEITDRFTGEALSDDAKEYLIREELTPTIVNISQAQSVASMVGPQMTEENDWTADQQENAINGIFTREAVADTPENRETAAWLIKRELPVTADNIEYKRALDEAVIVNPENSKEDNLSAVTGEIVKTLSLGSQIKDTPLVTGFGIDDKAQEALDVISAITDDDLAALIDRGEEISIRNLKRIHEVNLTQGSKDKRDAAVYDDGKFIRAKRMLEETRLVMTLEANRTLLKRGMSIDTAELSALVDELKEEENSYYRNIFGKDYEPSTEQIDALKTVINVAEELKYMPACAIGAADFDGKTLSSLHSEGIKAQKLYEAGERYETMSTEVRRDLGDSIKKAFQNVGDILKDLGYEKTEENERAVRILGYNSTEPSIDNIEKIKRADSLVQSAFAALKPAVVREMIKEGINPLNMDMRELKLKADSIKEKLPAFDENERFSRYLWRLEHDGEITQEERSSYIGIYRLIAQVEKNDSAAVGAVVETGRELNMQNLISAVRTAKKGTMDYVVDDAFGGAKGTIKGESITSQIMKAFSMMNGGAGGDGEEYSNEHQEKEKEYYEQMIKDMHHAAEASDDVYRAIKTYEVIPSVDNTIVMERLMQEPSAGLKRFFDLNREDFTEHDDIFEQLQAVKAEILDAFGEHVKKPDELEDAMETLANVAEHCGQTFIRENMTSLDLRQLQLSCRQLSVASNMAKSRHYNVPIMTEEGLTNVSFKLTSQGESGTLSVYMESERYGRLSAKLTVSEGNVRGYIASDSRAGVDTLKERIGELPGNIDVLFSRDVHDQAYSLENGDEKADVSELFDLATDVIRFIRS